MRKFLELVRWEHRAIWRRPFPAALFFLTPVFFCLLFGAVYQENTVRHIPMAVYDQDQSLMSRKLIQIYCDSDRFDVRYYVHTQEEMLALLHDGKIQFAMGIPCDFSRQIELNRNTEVVFLINSANNIFANSALTSMQENNRTFSVGIAQKMMEGLGMLPSAAMDAAYPVHIGIRILNNPTTGYTSFMLPGIVLNGLQIALLLTVTPILAALCRHSFYGPEYSSFMILLGKGIPYWFLGLLSYALSLGGLAWLWAVPVRADLWKLLLLGAVFIFAVICVLYLFSALCPDETFAVQLPLLYIMPGLLFSGLSWPTLSMQGFARWYSGIMPITYAAESMRDLLLAGYAPTLWQDIHTLLEGGILAGCMACGIFSLRRSGSLTGKIKKWRSKEHDAVPNYKT
jgi:ABC-2 type transport system permease protein